MWDIKLLLIDLFYITNTFFYNFFFFFLDTINPFLFESFSLVNWQVDLFLPQNFSIFFGIKFCGCIAFLILIRGGTPRYRYDYLTKLGWMKFLSLILLVLLFSILTYYIY